MGLADMRADLESHRIEGFTFHGDDAFSVPLVSHITGNLWTGGCRDGVVLPHDFGYVVSLYQWERYELGPDTERVEVEMYDAADALDDGEQLYDLARLVNRFRSQGKTLVHCQAGLNRSSLVAGLALVLEGMDPGSAIELLRQQRSPSVLCNPAFEQWLLERPPGG
ncbi:MAG: protein-tyrosine phosphatase family protein [Actinomycetota bacterium]